MTCYHNKNCTKRQKVQMYYQHTVDNIMVYIRKGNYLTNFVNGEPTMH